MKERKFKRFTIEVNFSESVFHFFLTVLSNKFPAKISC